MCKMTPEEIRFECLKLAHRHDWDASQVTAKAHAYELFVRGPDKQAGQAATLGLPRREPTGPADRKK
jgi:hypothetical protein